jgi:hypothetical protein
MKRTFLLCVSLLAIRLTVRPDRSLKLIACLGGVPGLTLRDGERTRCAIRARGHISFARDRHRIDFRRRDQPICTIELRSSS